MTKNINSPVEEIKYDKEKKKLGLVYEIDNDVFKRMARALDYLAFLFEDDREEPSGLTDRGVDVAKGFYAVVTIIHSLYPEFDKFHKFNTVPSQTKSRKEAAGLVNLFRMNHPGTKLSDDGILDVLTVQGYVY